jgi:hypothetical protein
MPLTLCVVVSRPAWVVLAASIAPREASATVWLDRAIIEMSRVRAWNSSACCDIELETSPTMPLVSAMLTDSSPICDPMTFMARSSLAWSSAGGVTACPSGDSALSRTSGSSA